MHTCVVNVSAEVSYSEACLCMRGTIYRGAYRLRFDNQSVCCVLRTVYCLSTLYGNNTDCERCTGPNPTNPGYMEAGEYVLHIWHVFRRTPSRGGLGLLAAVDLVVWSEGGDNSIPSFIDWICAQQPHKGVS